MALGPAIFTSFFVALYFTIFAHSGPLQILVQKAANSKYTGLCGNKCLNALRFV